LRKLITAVEGHYQKSLSSVFLLVLLNPWGAGQEFLFHGQPERLAEILHFPVNGRTFSAHVKPVLPVEINAPFIHLDSSNILEIGMNGV
jgi:hypothetical protein